MYFRDRQEHAIYRELLRMVPGLEERIMEPGELEVVAEHVRCAGYYLVCSAHNTV